MKTRSPEQILNGCFDAAQADLPSDVQLARMTRRLAAAGVAVVATANAAGVGAGGAATVGSSSAGGTTVASAGFGAGTKFIAALLVAGAIGGGGYVLWPGPAAEHTEPVIAGPASPAGAAVVAPAKTDHQEAKADQDEQNLAPPQPATKPDQRSRLSARSTPSASSPAPASAPETALTDVAPEPKADLAGELKLLRQAQRLASSDPHQALTLLQEHQASYPQSRMAQERELIQIEAWVKSGQRAQAQRAAASFQQRHPHSALLPRMKALVGLN